jgi:hypothetical protein
VKSIIETYSGTIWVESELGKGSTFRFTINGKYMNGAAPMTSAADDDQTEADAPPIGSEPEGQRQPAAA